MGFFLAVAILWFVIGRWRGRMWSRACVGPMYWGPRGRHAGVRGRFPSELPVLAAGGRRPPRREATREGALEALKRRYVAGELSDEQYEQELDALFRATSVRGRA
jgi:hypothetical protein